MPCKLAIAWLQEVAWDPTGRYVATIVNAGEWLGRLGGPSWGTLWVDS